jgi:hypothetical protein
MIMHDLHSLPITDGTGAVVGMLDEHQIASISLRRRAESAPGHI